MRSRDTRPISWINAARKSFEAFPKGAQDEVMQALTVAAEGGKADIAKPLKGLGSGVLEVGTEIPRGCLPHRLCRPTRQRHLGATRFPEEGDAGDQDTKEGG